MNTNESFRNPWEKFHGPNLGYVMEMYERYLQDPSLVDPELKDLFDRWGPPEIQDVNDAVDQKYFAQHTNVRANLLEKYVQAIKLADDIRTFGHLDAQINPLETTEKDSNHLDLQPFGLTEEDLKSIPASIISAYLPSYMQNGLEAIQYLKTVYTSKLAFEFGHVQNIEEKNWLLQMVESGSYIPSISNAKKMELLKRLTEVEVFEQFLHRTFVGQKRFSIEGVDTLVPLLDEIISESVQAGTKTINIGMAHRGRLNVLAHVLGKPYEMIFAEFQHAPNKDLIPSEGSIGITYGWTGDVKYHLGLDRKIKKENTVRAVITLANNPSHLEFVNPVVVGYTRAAQETRSAPGFPKQDENQSLAILIHGDAAFPGQGVVAETLNLSRLKGYQTGGTIHIIANNMIGFTTESEDSRSTKYASDLAKGFEIPIVHVNADDPEAVLAAAHFAVIYRQTFKKDFLIDLIGYRRHGHNEMDEPAATNPVMYQIIRKHPTVRNLYKNRLKQQGIIRSTEEVDRFTEEIEKRLQAAYEKVASVKEELDYEMNPPEVAEKGISNIDTTVPVHVLERVNHELVQWPENFHVFNKLERILQRRITAFQENKIDWAHAEALAFATILQDGIPIRLTGQDSERGTFAQRHLVLHDEKTGKVFSPLHHLSGSRASFAIHNSPLSETSVLGFEYGYNVFAPETLVLWEAQFGDFANSAQVIIDQFISSGRAKWGQKSGLMMLLPHGYEGQGPEHSSARLERFLTLAAENNWTVANMTKSSQYFHILRRQALILQKEEVRPLIIMSPKSLLRHPLVMSKVADLSEGSFQPVLPQPGLGYAPEKVERLILCSGKIAIDLAEKLEEIQDKNWFHILRVEELYPFPMEEIARYMKQFPNLKEMVWVQEEPKNMGAWNFVEPRLLTLAPAGVQVAYVGRRRRSSTAEGDPIVHKKEQARIINQAFTRS
ncbi:2-oxoglutarate dehydrogenase E1 component [Anoxybacteroides amylolyticum]|uniref:2-oxoglutarate dehydrogenase E1 component n=1 Tax=Anoxybacteroides amylolyticum TaxID=294699 RepID=A0A160F1R2_9BACL|nr:2-oxoglutarate dehydrogenase E1 component [Anoxybacillus amylolyticus]ANB59353.1 oxoglutarate dehydrogenase (succinyl-transferring), E1 component [Anoxybacillus amylolyticus]